MAISRTYPQRTDGIGDIVLNTTIDDISTAGSAWVVSPFGGNITKIETVIDTAITVGDATITAEIGGTLVTDSTITITQSGSAAGDVRSDRGHRAAELSPARAARR